MRHRKLLGRARRGWVLAALLAAAAVCSLLGQGVSARMRSAASYALAPLGDAGMYLSTSMVGRGDAVGWRAVSPSEIQRLVEANEELHRRLLAVESDNANLRRRQRAMSRLYGAIPHGQWELVAARVVGADSLPYGRSRLVNAGASRGAGPGDAVTTRALLTDRSKALPANLAAIAGSALAGRIVEAGAFTARLQLVTDRGFRIRARVHRVVDGRRITVTTGQAAEQALTEANNHAIPVEVRGDGSALVVEDVNAYHNVLPGDWVVAAGDDAFLPVQIPIGRVVGVEDDPRRMGLFVRLKVRPYVRPETLREVYIVVPAGAAQEASR